MGYLKVIKTAIFVFPFLVLILTFPFLIYHYRKYGSVSFFRSIVVYSFYFYLLCCFFLVIMPLPSRSAVALYTRPYYNLKPFYFVPDFISSAVFDPTDISTYFLIFKQFKYLEPIFNILMVIPFGIYLRYYFKCGFFKTLFFSFCLSLFFEVTQITGLYFIYPRPYRLFDVNDLINNTLGGVIGFMICPLLSFFLPSREKIDMNDYINSMNVSVFKRFVALAIDYFLLLVCVLIGGFFVHFRIKYICIFYLIINFLYFVLLPFVSGGYTFGKWFLHFRNVGNDVDYYIGFFKLFLKWIILHLCILNGWLLIIIYRYYFKKSIYMFITVYSCAFCLFVFHVFFSWIVKKKVFYDDILKLDSVSVFDSEDDVYEEI